MKSQKFGIEIEITGLTRRQAEVIARHFGSSVSHDGGSYDAYSVLDTQNRKWKLVSDSSISAECRFGTATSEHRVELVSPICEWNDIETIQELVRELRRAGAVSNSSCGIHVHVDASRFDSRSLRNITNIMASKEALIYKALQVKDEREHQYCKKVDTHFLEELNRRRPKSLDAVKRIWYDGDANKQYLKARMEKEKNPKVRELLAADFGFLDEIQIESSTTREFLALARFRSMTPQQVLGGVGRIEKAIKDQGFEARRAEKEEIRRVLAIYFEGNLAGGDDD